MSLPHLIYPPLQLPISEPCNHIKGFPEMGFVGFGGIRICMLREGEREDGRQSGLLMDIRVEESRG